MPNRFEGQVRCLCLPSVVEPRSPLGLGHVQRNRFCGWFGRLPHFWAGLRSSHFLVVLSSQTTPCSKYQQTPSSDSQTLPPSLQWNPHTSSSFFSTFLALCPCSSDGSQHRACSFGSQSWVLLSWLLSAYLLICLKQTFIFLFTFTYKRESLYESGSLSS